MHVPSTIVIGIVPHQPGSPLFHYHGCPYATVRATTGSRSLFPPGCPGPESTGTRVVLAMMRFAICDATTSVPSPGHPLPRTWSSDRSTRVTPVYLHVALPMTLTAPPCCWFVLHMVAVVLPHPWHPRKRLHRPPPAQQRGATQRIRLDI